MSLGCSRLPRPMVIPSLLGILVVLLADPMDRQPPWLLGVDLPGR